MSFNVCPCDLSIIIAKACLTGTEQVTLSKSYSDQAIVELADDEHSPLALCSGWSMLKSTHSQCVLPIMGGFSQTISSAF